MPLKMVREALVYVFEEKVDRRHLELACLFKGRFGSLASRFPKVFLVGGVNETFADHVFLEPSNWVSNLLKEVVVHGLLVWSSVSI